MDVLSQACHADSPFVLCVQVLCPARQLQLSRPLPLAVALLQDQVRPRAYDIPPPPSPCSRTLLCLQAHSAPVVTGPASFHVDTQTVQSPCVCVVHDSMGALTVIAAGCSIVPGVMCDWLQAVGGQQVLSQAAPCSGQAIGRQAGGSRPGQPSSYCSLCRCPQAGGGCAEVSALHCDWSMPCSLLNSGMIWSSAGDRGRQEMAC
jgi:hypothetical protein